MFREGPIPRFIHGVLEYAAAGLFIAAPFIFGFDSGAATAIAIVIGVAILLFTGFSALPTGLAKSIPMQAHAMLDFVWGALFVAMPFIAGFSGESAPTVFFIAMGVAWLVVSIGTRYDPGEKPRTTPRERRRFLGSGPRRGSRQSDDLNEVPEFELPVSERRDEPFPPGR
jgi:hypothetical protein